MVTSNATYSIFWANWLKTNLLMYKLFLKDQSIGGSYFFNNSLKTCKKKLAIQFQCSWSSLLFILWLIDHTDYSQAGHVVKYNLNLPMFGCSLQPGMITPVNTMWFIVVLIYFCILCHPNYITWKMEIMPMFFSILAKFYFPSGNVCIESAQTF